MPQQPEQPSTDRLYVHGFFNDPGPYALPEPPEESPAPEPPPARRSGSGLGGASLRSMAAVFMSTILVATLGVSMSFAISSEPRKLLVSDSFGRADGSEWGLADSGHRWMYPNGRTGISMGGGRGIMSLNGRANTLQTMLNTDVRDVTVVFSFSLDRMTGGSGVKVMTILRKSKGGSYRARVRVGHDGRVWLSVARTHGERSAKILGSQVLVKGWRYQAGQTVVVRAQAIKKDPTQVRMMAWPEGSAPPKTWQLVQNDSAALDVGGNGRVGLRAVVTKGASAGQARVRFDHIRVNRAQDALLARVTPARPRSQTPPRDDGPRQPDAPTDTTKPEIVEVEAQDITPSSAIIQWTLSEPANGFVKYGDTKRYGRESVHEDSYKYKTHVRQLTGLEPGTLYHYAIVSEDSDGNRKVSRDLTFTTTGGSGEEPGPDPTPTPTPTPPTDEPDADTSAPSLLDLEVMDLTDSSARVTWTLDEASTGFVEYGTSDSYGERTRGETSFDYQTHVQRLRDLDADTTYHYRVVSEDRAGNRMSSGNRTFRTAEAQVSEPTPAPTASPTPAPTATPTAAPTPAPTATPTAAPAATPQPTPAPTATPTAAPAATPQPTPTATAAPTPTATPQQGDTVSPVVSAISAFDVSTTAAKVTWTLDEPANGHVEYGPTNGYGSRTAGEDSFDFTTHVQSLTGLAPGTTYHYRVVSEDQAGNRVVSADQTFETASAPASPAPTPTATTPPAPTPTPSPAPTATPQPTPAATPQPTPTPTSGPSNPSAVVTDTFGVAFAATDKSNRQVREGAHAFRFVARQGGIVRHVRFQATNRAEPYGGGDAGRYRVGVQDVDGNGFPTGTYLGGTTVWDPVIVSSPQNFPVGVTIDGGANLVVGRTYAIVIEHIGTNPDVNRTSINLPWLSGAQLSDQPFWGGSGATAFLDGAEPYRSPLSWSVNSSHLPAFDLEYTNGKHEGAGGVRGVEQTDRVGIVSSSSTSTWTFTAGSTFDIDAINVWLWAVSGSTDARVSVRQGNNVVASGTLNNSGSMSDGARDWRRAALSQTVRISAGQTYRVDVSTTSGQYYLPLMFWQDAGSKSHPDRMMSFPYENGSNPHRADDSGGAVWSAWYEHTSFMMYAEVVD